MTMLLSKMSNWTWWNNFINDLKIYTLEHGMCLELLNYFFFTKNKDYVFSKACVKKTEMIKTLHNKNKSLDSSRSGTNCPLVSKCWILDLKTNNICAL